MQIIPAIDIQGGRCVRLLRGEFEQETVYADDPVAVAQRWVELGAELVHVVDLDGAREGRPVHVDLVRRIAGAAPIQLGGGLRREADVHQALDAGVQRVVMGTAATRPEIVGPLAEELGDRLVVALDTRNGMVAVEGWVTEAGMSLHSMAESLQSLGVHRVLHTDVERDGTMTSPNYTSLSDLIALDLAVIASGGVASTDQLVRLRELGAEAAIVGRALYEGTIDLAEAIAVAR